MDKKANIKLDVAAALNFKYCFALKVPKIGL
jgi:hypothetical protein